ncbi:MAG: threonine synthase [Bacillota bacterium]|jgi:threonine synthase
MWSGLLQRYADLLPVGPDTPVVTLHEGNTPLIPLTRLSRDLPGLNIFAKYEGANPTGSFKDRGMTLAVSKAKEAGARAVICASTGNTSASAAAYAARAQLDCVVLIPEGKIALGKLAQAVHYGAKVIAIQGNFDQALAIAREIVQDEPLTLVNSVNPYRIIGQQTAAWEVLEQLGTAPDFLAIPVGNAGNITAYWRGFRSAQQRSGSSLPRMLGFEAWGSAAIVRGQPILQPETIATAIRIGNPASWQTAVEAAEQSAGLIDAVSDEEILAAYRQLARHEGIFCEPASAASLAGVIKLYHQGYFRQQSATVVCVLTGNGLKDPDNAVAGASAPIRVAAEKAAILAAIKE